MMPLREHEGVVPLIRPVAADAAPLPRWAWLHLPAAVFILLHAFWALAPAFFQRRLIPEDGFIEYATPLLLVVALAIAVRAIRRAPRWLRIWLAVFALGCFYFAGEEVSWGQRIVGWSTPETWGAVNKQEETNIHNVSAIFDSKPRLALSLAALVGGIIYPLFARARKSLNRVVPATAWPTYICTPAAALALTVGLPDRIADTLGVTRTWMTISEPGEVKELYFALFLMLYAASVAARLRATR